MPSAVKSMRDILNSVIADTQKHSAEGVNPPTSGPGTGCPDNEQAAPEGQRSAENASAIKDLLGNVSAETAPSADTNTGDYNQPHRAAKLAPTGEDPENESRTESLPTMAEPGTSAAGLSLGEKVSAWTDSAGDLLYEYCLEHKLATEALPPALRKTAAAAATMQATGSDYGSESDDPYLVLTNGDVEQAKVAYQIVHDQLAEAHRAGKYAAEVTIQYLEYIKQASAQPAPAQRPAPTRSYATSKRAMGMPPGDGGGMPPGPPMPPPGGGDMGGGGMPPDMGGMEGGGMEGGGMEGGGMEGSEMAQDPAVIEQALMELAAEMGVSPEELVQMLQAEMGGMEGGGEPPMDMGGMEGGGGMPPEMGGMEGGGGMPPEGGGGPPAEAAEKDSGGDKESSEWSHRIKVAAAINTVKKNATDILREKTRRGQR